MTYHKQDTCGARELYIDRSGVVQPHIVATGVELDKGVGGGNLPTQGQVPSLPDGTVYQDIGFHKVLRVSPHTPVPKMGVLSTMMTSTSGILLTNSTTYVAAETLGFAGKTVVGTPVTFLVGVGVGGGAATVTARVQDLTNGTTIAGPTSTSNAALALLTMPYNNNATNAAAVWQLQFQSSSAMTSVSVGGLTITFG